MNKPQSIDQILHAYKDMSMNGTERGYSGMTFEEAKAAIEAMVREIIGDDLPTFGPQNEAGDISEDDYMIAGYNDAKYHQRLRASKYNLKLEKE